MNKSEWLASRCPNEAAKEPLWCCHVKGVDDMYAAGSKAEAEAWATWVNGMGEGDLQAEAVPWPYSAEAHADDLPNAQLAFGANIGGL